jgi:hypothetical protein
MTTQEQLQELEKVAQSLQIRVSYEPMAGLVQGTGGLCKVKGEFRIIMDRRLKPAERLQIVVDALRHFDTSQLALPPTLRRLLSQ